MRSYYTKGRLWSQEWRKPKLLHTNITYTLPLDLSVPWKSFSILSFVLICRYTLINLFQGPWFQYISIIIECIVWPWPYTSWTYIKGMQYFLMYTLSTMYVWIIMIPYPLLWYTLIPLIICLHIFRSHMKNIGFKKPWLLSKNILESILWRIGLHYPLIYWNMNILWICLCVLIIIPLYQDTNWSIEIILAQWIWMIDPIIGFAYLHYWSQKYWHPINIFVIQCLAIILIPIPLHTSINTLRIGIVYVFLRLITLSSSSSSVSSSMTLEQIQQVLAMIVYPI